MSEVIDGNSIKVPEQSKLEAYEKLPASEKQEVTEQVIEMQAAAADVFLKGADGFDILTQLNKSCAELILTTATFVIPVTQDLENICANLKDPEGFKRSFKTLCADIATYNTNLSVLASCHAGKTGQPSADEITDVLTLADGYNKLNMHFENAIQPLMQALGKIIDQEYTAVLESQLNAIA